MKRAIRSHAGLTLTNLFHAFLAASALIALCAATAGAQANSSATAGAPSEGQELPVHQIPNLGRGAEFYFSPDSTHIIGNAQRESDSGFRVYTLKIDGTDIRRIEDKGDDACSFYFPDGKRIIWTSTKDHLDLPKSNYSNPTDYPQGSELYTSNLDGTDVKRLTNNTVYDAEVSVGPNGQWILFGSERSGKMELWKMKPDGSDPVQITHLEGWEPGGAFIFRDNKTIIFRAWRCRRQKTPPAHDALYDSGRRHAADAVDPRRRHQLVSVPSP
jgi:hypothetical protein